MTLGELHKKLAEVDKAKQALADAERAIEFGGNADTMQRKRQWLAHAQDVYEALINEELE